MSGRKKKLKNETILHCIDIKRRQFREGMKVLK